MFSRKSFKDQNKTSSNQNFKSDELFEYIQQRNIDNNDLIIDIVDGNNPHPVNIIPRYTHQIKNIGEVTTHTIMWISEIYNLNTADTYKEEL